MAIEKYVTEAIVIEAFDQGEHDRVYRVFTREFGLLMCHAKSIRKLESKLRAHVLPRSLSLLTLVKGKDVWRLTGAQSIHYEVMYIHEVAALTNRFIKGEGAHKKLYDRLLQFLQESNNYQEPLARLLLYYVLLVELGYADAKVIGVKSIEEYITFSMNDLYTHLLLTQKDVRKHIQEVLKEMQL